MTVDEIYHSLLPRITAIPREKVIVPNNIRVKDFIVEAFTLDKAYQEDREVLLAHGLSAQLADELTDRAFALQHAETLWFFNRHKKNEAETQWAIQYPAAVRLKKELLHNFRFAFQRKQKLLLSVKKEAVFKNKATFIQSLTNLACIGQSQAPLLQAINFDMAKLEEARQFGSLLWGILAEKEIQLTEGQKALVIRNQAYTLLKEVVDAIREMGKFVFWRDEERKHHYTSDYLRKKNKRYRAKAEPVAVPLHEELIEDAKSTGD